MEGHVVEIAWSQTDIDKVFVKGSKTMEEAIAFVSDRCNCPRVWPVGTITKSYDIT